MPDDNTTPPAKMADEVADRVASKLAPQLDDLLGLVRELKGETEVLREVVDTLASQDDFASLDRKITSVSADTVLSLIHI